jgi:hypothetical protein
LRRFAAYLQFFSHRLLRQSKGLNFELTRDFSFLRDPLWKTPGVAGAGGAWNIPPGAPISRRFGEQAGRVGRQGDSWTSLLLA